MAYDHKNSKVLPAQKIYPKALKWGSKPYLIFEKNSRLIYIFEAFNVQDVQIIFLTSFTKLNFRFLGTRILIIKIRNDPRAQIITHLGFWATPGAQ